VRPIECTREDDVLDALSSDRWPDRADQELRDHVASCEICADLVDVAGPILVDREAATPEPRIPSPAVMWWRAQMRARQEAAREAERPITVAQAIAAMSALVLVVGLAITVAPWLRTLLPEGITMDVAGLLGQAALLGHGWLLPALMLCVWFVLTPLAIYFVVVED
jgi:hypothetical protein